jgi:hypothetical protein
MCSTAQMWQVLFVFSMRGGGGEFEVKGLGFTEIAQMKHESERSQGDGKENLTAPFASPRQDVDRSGSTGGGCNNHNTKLIVK